MFNKSFLEARYKKERKSNFFYLRRDCLNRLFDKFINKNMRILDVACGCGEITEKLRTYGYHVFGCDGSFNALINVSFPSALCNIEYNIPFMDESFDAVVAGEIIEHINDTDRFVSEINRILRYDGLLFITTPNLAGLESRLAILFGKKPWMIENRIKDEYAGHIRYFTFDELEELLKDHGFKIVKRTSDYVKIRNLTFVRFAKIFPSLGQHVILVGRKTE